MKRLEGILDASVIEEYRAFADEIRSVRHEMKMVFESFPEDDMLSAKPEDEIGGSSELLIQ
jgi:hypothetical protein